MDDDYSSSLDYDSDSEQSLPPTQPLQQLHQQISKTPALNTVSSVVVDTSSSRPKINPFKPNSIKQGMSFERRRWVHIFPLRRDGTPIFPNQVTTTSNAQHYYHNSIELASNTLISPGGGGVKKAMNNSSNKENYSWDTLGNDGGAMSATMKTGVAWKSLTMPACLPLTTDCCPSKKRWNNNFSLLSHYRLLLGESCV